MILFMKKWKKLTGLFSDYFIIPELWKASTNYAYSYNKFNLKFLFYS